MRKQRDKLRSSRTWSTIAGVTLATLPSGVTITDDEILCGEGGTSISSSGIDFGVGSSAGYMKMAFGSIDWVGTTESIAAASHGLTTLTSWNAFYTDGLTTSVPIMVSFETPSGISVEARAQAILGGTTMIPASSGGTIKWQAFGS